MKRARSGYARRVRVSLVASSTQRRSCEQARLPNRHLDQEKPRPPPAEDGIPMQSRSIAALLFSCTLVAGGLAGQVPNADCQIAGPLQLECGSTGTWFGSLPVAVFPYSASWAFLNNNTGATFVGP